MQLDIMEAHPFGAPVRARFRKLYRELPRAEREYMHAVRQISVDVARFIERFTARPGLENTLFVLISDHGQGLTDHPGIKEGHSHGFLLYESQVRVPFILYDSGDRLPERVVSRQVRVLDLVPTILDLVDLPVPGGLDGVSLTPLLDDPPRRASLPPYLVTETSFREACKIVLYGQRAKLIANRDDWPDLPPRELQRLGGGERGAATGISADHPKLTAAMLAYLREWEQRHPEAPPTPVASPLSPEAIEQLRTLGYIQ